MFRNSYDDLLEPWKLELIERRARKRGFRGADLEDAQQTLVLELLDFQFDPTKSNGATEATALVAVIDRRLAMLRRCEQRHAARTERLKEAHARSQISGEETLAAGSDVPRLSLSLDVHEAIEDLPPLAQRICAALADGQSLNEIAKRLGLRWRAVREQVDGIRRYFAYLGLGLPAKSRDPAEEAA